MSDVTDLAAALIALAALGTSIHEMRAAANDRRIAVRPHIVFTRVTGNRSFKIFLRNNGLGPAEIVHFSFSANKKHYTIQQSSDFTPLLRDTGVNGCKLDHLAFMMPGDHLAANGELLVMELSQVEVYPGKEDILENCFEPLNVHVKYRSLYGEQFAASADLPRKL